MEMHICRLSYFYLYSFCLRKLLDPLKKNKSSSDALMKKASIKLLTEPLEKKDLIYSQDGIIYSAAF